MRVEIILTVFWSYAAGGLVDLASFSRKLPDIVFTLYSQEGSQEEQPTYGHGSADGEVDLGGGDGDCWEMFDW